MERQIKFFGVLRKYGDGRGFYQTTLTPGMTVEKLKTQLKQELSQKFPEKFDAGIVDESAFASAAEVLELSSVVPTEGDLALLPPVCGG